MMGDGDDQVPAHPLDELLADGLQQTKMRKSVFDGPMAHIDERWPENVAELQPASSSVREDAWVPEAQDAPGVPEAQDALGAGSAVGDSTTVGESEGRQQPEVQENPVGGSAVEDSESMIEWTDSWQPQGGSDGACGWSGWHDGWHHDDSPSWSWPQDWQPDCEQPQDLLSKQTLLGQTLSSAITCSTGGQHAGCQMSQTSQRAKLVMVQAG